MTTMRKKESPSSATARMTTTTTITPCSPAPLHLATRDSVGTEGMELLLGAVTIYVFAELRDMVREGMLPDLEMKDLEPPLTAARMMQLLQEYRSKLEARAQMETGHPKKEQGDTDTQPESRDAHAHEYLESRLKAMSQAYEQQQQQQKCLQEESRQTGQEHDPGPSLQKNLTNVWSMLRGGIFGNPQTIIDNGDKNATINRAENTNNDSETSIHRIVLTQFVDDHSQEEIVHGIVVNHVKRRITIVFRGSVTSKDFLQDAKCQQILLQNPVLPILQNEQTNLVELEQMPPTIRIHTGFWEYLQQGNRLESILKEIKELLRKDKCKGFSVYMTGHSLGGALSTLCGFFAACDEELIALAGQNRVVVFSFASPFCGNWKFRHAFSTLEKRKRIQHLRIANREDMVTLMPFCIPKATFLSPALSMVQGAGNLYKHVGIKLQLSQLVEENNNNNNNNNNNSKEQPTTAYSLSYPREHHADTDDTVYAKEVMEAVDAGKSLIKALYFICKTQFGVVERFHSCQEYEERLEGALRGSDLTTITLDDLYQNQDIVGSLFSEQHSLVHLPKSGIARTLRAVTALSKIRREATKTTPPENTHGQEENTEQEEETAMTLTQAAMSTTQ